MPGAVFDKISTRPASSWDIPAMKHDTLARERMLRTGHGRPGQDGAGKMVTTVMAATMVAVVSVMVVVAVVAMVAMVERAALVAMVAMVARVTTAIMVTGRARWGPR